MNMNKIMKDAVLIAVTGAAGYCAYQWMTPESKRQISRDVKRTAEDMSDVKKDMAHMATTIKNTF
ncbi:MAG: hypothetical protein RR313_03785 [Anaerovoracaceae bacterium]